ncbi:MAG TPA: DUF1887 family CARF protein [Melioribacteraceae bacterium]|nr:DUF1887 family CARF protein [Melioribacteraceae bacterium]
MGKVLFNIISGQLQPNVIAIKNYNPDICVLFYTDSSIGQLNNLIETFQKIQFEKIKIDAWDYYQIYETVKSTMNNYKDKELLINFTCGTKIMSMACYNAGKEFNAKNIYVNTEANEISEFTDKQEKYKIDVIDNIEEIFLLNGQKIKKSKDSISKEYEKFYNFILNNYKKYNDFINSFARQFNKQKSEKSKLDGKIKDSVIKYDGQKGIVKLVFEGKTLYEHEEEGLEFLSFVIGGWFEYHCYKALQNIGYFDELQLNLKLQGKSVKPNSFYSDKNEIDIMGVKGVYPYLFECKTGAFNAQNIDKLFGIKDYIGRYSNLYIITYFPFDRNLEKNKNVVEKAKEKKIEIITYNDLISKKINFDKKANLR